MSNSAHDGAVCFPIIHFSKILNWHFLFQKNGKVIFLFNCGFFFFKSIQNMPTTEHFAEKKYHLRRNEKYHS